MGNKHWSKREMNVIKDNFQILWDGDLAGSRLRRTLCAMKEQKIESANNKMVKVGGHLEPVSKIENYRIVKLNIPEAKLPIYLDAASGSGFGLVEKEGEGGRSVNSDGNVFTVGKGDRAVWIVGPRNANLRRGDFTPFWNTLDALKAQAKEPTKK